MSTEGDDFRIGVPGSGRPPLAVVPAPGPRLHEPEPELRAGDTELGRPLQVPTDLAELGAAERAALARLEADDRARDEAEADALLGSDPTGFAWLGWFASPLALALAFGTVGVFGVFVFNQAVQLIDALARQPLWAQSVGYTGLGLFGCCIVFALARFLWLYARLRRNRQLRAKGLRELNARTRLRWLAAQKAAEARGQLEAYLREYPIDTERQRRALQRLGLTDAACARLRAAREELLNPDKFASTDQWFARFRDAFQSVIDGAAEGRINYWSSRIWVVTAVSPNAVVDSGAALFYTFSMLSDLCELYNLRAGRTGTAVLLGRTFFNAYLAGQGAEWEKLAEDQYDQLFQEAMSAVGVGMSANVVGKIVGKVGAKVTTGYLNRVLLVRLGRYASRLLRPVSKE